MKYSSKYSPNKDVTAAQYITEIICEHKAYTLNIELPKCPWKLAETDFWKKYFKQQIPAAHKLLKEFDERDIITALSKVRHIYSLRNPYLKVLVKQEEIKRKKRETAKPIEIGSTTEKPKRFSRKNKLDKLKDLE